MDTFMERMERIDRGENVPEHRPMRAEEYLAGLVAQYREVCQTVNERRESLQQAQDEKNLIRKKIDEIAEQVRQEIEDLGR